MKVLLIQPPVEDFYDTSIRTYPLGLLYVATRVGQVAEVTILDARTGKHRTVGRHPFPELAPFYMEGLSTPFSFFSRYSRYGMSDGEISEAIRREKPDVVGIASLCSAYERQAIQVARLAKIVDPGIITVLGGTHPTVFPEHILHESDVDYSIRGEGETPFFSLVSALQSGDHDRLDRISGLCFRKGSRLHLSEPHVEPDIDLIPNRGLVDPDNYRIGKRRYAFLLTSRGCPFHCGFCGKPPVPYRRRGLSGIEQEIGECASIGIGAIDFEDDMLNLDRRFFSDVLRLLTGRGFTLSAMNGIYPGNVDVRMMNEMHEAGFRRLNFSLVDIADPVLAGQKRRQSDAFIDLLPFLEDSSFLVEVHFIIGLPGQEPGRLLDTLLFLMDKRLLLGPSVFYLAPGSALSRSNGPFAQISFSQMRSSFMFPINPLFPRTVTFTLVKMVRFINWVKQVIDKSEGAERISDLLGGRAMPGDETSGVIIERLLREKRLVRYERSTGTFGDEPVDQGLVASFFGRAQGRHIKGFKTNRSVLMDV